MIDRRGATKKVKGYCVQCMSSCPIICHVKDGVFTKVEPDKEHPNANSLCPKGVAGPELVYNRQRLQYPMRRRKPKDAADPGWERISWDVALDTIATRLNQIKAKLGPEAVVFNRAGVGSAASADFGGWVFRLAHAFGTPNVISTTHVCQWHRDTGSTYTYGRKGMGMPEFDQTACILIWGHNPYATSRSNIRDIRQALARGAKLIVIDPRRTEIAARADLWLQVRPGTDGALALSMLNVMIEEDLYDHEFTKGWTTAPFLVRNDNKDFLKASNVIDGGDPASYVVWDSVSQSPKIYDLDKSAYETPFVVPTLGGAYQVKLVGGERVECKTAFQLLRELASEYPPERDAALTGVPEDKIKNATRMLATTKPACYYTFNGIEQHTNATQTNRAICILYALTGNYDAPGGNVIFPTIPVNPISGAEFLNPEIEGKRLGFEERPLGPAGLARSTQAYEVYKAILTGKPYPCGAMVAFGGNIITANSDSIVGREALAKLEFYAQVEFFLTPSAQLADVVLPAATFYEGWHVRSNFQCGKARSHVQLRQRVVPPLHDSRPDLEIIFELAKRLGLSDKFWDGDIEAAFNYELAPSGITVQALRNKPGGISLNLPVEYKNYAKKDPNTGGGVGFGTPSGKMEIYSQSFKEHGYYPLPVWEEPMVTPFAPKDLAQKYPLVLICAKVLQFCHGQHRALPSLRKGVPYPFLQINPEKAKELDCRDGDWVAVESPYGSIRLKAKLTEDIPYGVVCTQHGWWQACPELNLPGFDPYSSEGANINLVYSSHAIDPISGSLPYKAYACDVRRL